MNTLPFKSPKAPNRGGGSPFGKKDEKPDKPERSAKLQGMLDRARIDHERYIFATDTGFWFTLSFKTGEALTEFMESSGWGAIGGRQLDGHQVAALLGISIAKGGTPPSAVSAPSFGGGDWSDPAPDPLAGIEYTGDLEIDAALELDALFGALVASDARDGDFRYAKDSTHWVALCFGDRAAKERFLRITGLVRFGDKYLDGHRAAEVLTSKYGVSSELRDG